MKGKRTIKKSGRKMATNVAISAKIPRSDFLTHHVGGVSQSIRRTLVWTYSGTFAYSANTYYESAVVILNSPYDPDAALGGVSATGFAKLMAFYSKCFTLGSRIKFKLVNSSATDIIPTQTPIVYGITITTNTTSLASISGAVNVGLSDYDVVGNSPDHRTLSLGVDIAKFVDKPQILDDPQFFCTVAANPAQVIVAHCWAANINNVSGGSIIVVEVEFDCVFTDPIPFT